jgi:hypothetical protein
MPGSVRPLPARGPAWQPVVAPPASCPAPASARPATACRAACSAASRGGAPVLRCGGASVPARKDVPSRTGAGPPGPPRPQRWFPARRRQPCPQWWKEGPLGLAAVPDTVSGARSRRAGVGRGRPRRFLVGPQRKAFGGAGPRRRGHGTRATFSRQPGRWSGPPREDSLPARRGKETPARATSPGEPLLLAPGGPPALPGSRPLIRGPAEAVCSPLAPASRERGEQTASAGLCARGLPADEAELGGNQATLLSCFQDDGRRVVSQGAL